MDDGSVTPGWRLVRGPVEDGVPTGPGDVTDADDEHLRVLRRTVAEPVVRSLLTDEELEAITVRRGAGGDPDGAWVRVVAVGEVFHGWLPRPSRPGAEDGWTPRECAEHLADALEDWVAESRFGWGQQRIARYVLPPS